MQNVSIPKQVSMLDALTKILTFFKSHKIFTFSHINSTNFDSNFKDNFMLENVNKMASKAKTCVRLSLTKN